MKVLKILFYFVLMRACTFDVSAGVSGKINGTITNDATKEPLISVNVMIEGTRIGTTTDIDGYYSILNVPPGT
ncbi:MAG: carboxypeptidase-like regulatory domain-containing protein, partial [Bacteroidota bacterium]